MGFATVYFGSEEDAEIKIEGFQILRTKARDKWFTKVPNKRYKNKDDEWKEDRTVDLLNPELRKQVEKTILAAYSQETGKSIPQQSAQTPSDATDSTSGKAPVFDDGDDLPF